MSLPTITVMNHPFTIPSTGKEIKIRPFLVSEQKKILQAKEMGDESALRMAVEEVVKACSFGEVTIDSPIYDVEYLLLRTRAISVGNIVDLRYRCRHVHDDGTVCNGKPKVMLDLLNVSVKKNPDHQYKILLTPDVGMVMKDTSFAKWTSGNGSKDPAVHFDLLASCIDTIFDADQVYSRSDFTNNELIDWLGAMGTDKFEEVERFMRTQPVLEHQVKVKCPVCKTETISTLRGLDSFLV